VFDRNLLVFHYYFLHHQAQNPLLRFIARLLQSRTHVTTKFFHRRHYFHLSFLILLLSFEREKADFELCAILIDACPSFFERVSIKSCGNKMRL